MSSKPVCASTIISALALCVMGWMAGCTPTAEKNNASAAVNDYTLFLDSLEAADMHYTAAEWETIRRDYEIKRAAVENQRYLFTEDEAEKVEENNKRFTEVTKSYEAEARKVVRANIRTHLMQVLKIQAMSQEPDSITRSNLLHTYQQFVDEVQRSNKYYSSAEWTAVDSLWDKLNTRKKLLGDSIRTDAANEINKIKVAYGQFKTSNRSNQVSAEGG